jgi:HPt (histidine-containing phosphotransfer) domain-containing protein
MRGSISTTQGSIVSEPTIDPATFAALQDVAGPEFADELVETFLEEAPTMFADLCEALAANDAERYRRAAHSLKSNANTFGATTLASMAQAVEHGGIDASSAGTLETLGIEYTRVAEALKALRHG